MKLEDIEKEWSIDAEINSFKLGDESLKIPKLHSKYYAILTKEKLLLMKFIKDLDQMEYILEQYYAKTLTIEEMEMYKLDDVIDKKYMKADIPKAICNTPDIITQKIKIGTQNVKIDFLESILKMVMNRNFAIRDAIEWRKFEAGG